MLLYAFEHYSTNESKVKLRATKFDVDDFDPSQLLAHL